MSELTNAEAALLGLLSEESMHPYRIEQEVKYREMRFWTDLSMSAIYKLLRKLEEDGFVQRENEISEENRLRKLYSISAAGKKALADKIERLLCEPEHIRWRFDIGIYNSELLPPGKVRTALEQYKQTLEKRIREYERLLEFLRGLGCTAPRLALATRPMRLLRAEVEWVEEYLAGLE